MNKTKNDLGLVLSNLWVSAAVGDRGLGICFSHAFYLYFLRIALGWWIRCLEVLGLAWLRFVWNEKQQISILLSILQMRQLSLETLLNSFQVHSSIQLSKLQGATICGTPWFWSFWPAQSLQHTQDQSDLQPNLSRHGHAVLCRPDLFS